MDGNNTNVGAVTGSMTLTDNATGKSIELPVIDGSIGPKVIDVRKLYAQTGYFTYDPGFMATAACRSSITYIDGDEGVLMYRGYPIQELADKSDFLEVSYLLLNGELPTAKQKVQFVSDITHHTMVHEQIATFFRGFRRDAHPMEAAEERRNLLVHHRVMGDVGDELHFLLRRRQFAVEQEVGDLEEIALVGQFLDRIAAIHQDALVAVDIGDAGAAG